VLGLVRVSLLQFLCVVGLLLERHGICKSTAHTNAALLAAARADAEGHEADQEQDDYEPKENRSQLASEEVEDTTQKVGDAAKDVANDRDSGMAATTRSDGVREFQTRERNAQFRQIDVIQ